MAKQQKKEGLDKNDVRLIFKKDVWYKLTWNYLGKTRENCVRIILKKGDYLFWFRRSPDNKEDEFCMGVKREQIIKAEPWN